MRTWAVRIEAWITLLAVDLLLAILGLRQVFKLLTWLFATRSRSPGDMSLRNRLAEAYDFALASYVRPVQCLHRSLTIFILARRRGVHAIFFVGVRKFPFQSHAWVEIGDLVFEREASFIRTLHPILQLE